MTNKKELKFKTRPTYSVFILSVLQPQFFIFSLELLHLDFGVLGFVHFPLN